MSAISITIRTARLDEAEVLALIEELFAPPETLACGLQRRPSAVRALRFEERPAG